MVRSEYVAVTDPEGCAGCSECVDRCPFEVRRLDGDLLICRADHCLGCGLCVTACPAGAVSMGLRGA